MTVCTNKTIDNNLLFFVSVKCKSNKNEKLRSGENEEVAGELERILEFTFFYEILIKFKIFGEMKNLEMLNQKFQNMQFRSAGPISSYIPLF